MTLLYNCIIFGSLMDKKKNKKKGKQDEEKQIQEEKLDVDKLAQELNSYLKVNQDNFKKQEKESDIAREIKKKGQDLLIRAKEIKEQNKLEELFNLAVSITNSNLINDVRYIAEVKPSHDKLTRENLNLTEEINLLKSKTEEQVKSSKYHMDVIKSCLEEKRVLQVDEENKRVELVKKAEEIVSNVREKYSNNGPSSEDIIAENNKLRAQLEEAKKFWNENFKDGRFKLEEDLQNIFDNQFKDITDQAKEQMRENEVLKMKVEVFTQKFDGLNGSISQYNQIYDSLKKDAEKVNIFLFLEKQRGLFYKKRGHNIAIKGRYYRKEYPDY